MIALAFLSYFSPLLFYSVFFYDIVIHPDLLSFPTRRSSDLAAGRPRRLPVLRVAERNPESPTRGRRSRDCSGERQRSEEHTSELQSRFDLVCRLLLEKKNFLLSYQ